jgi:tetratricopeptide (TPR) repeat protein
MSQSLVTGMVLGSLISLRLQRIPKLIPPVVASILGIVWLFPYPFKPYAFHYLVAEDNFLVETCNFIDTNQLSGNLFSYFDWGGYIHYRTMGRMKVYIDGRADTVYDNQTLIRYATVQGFRAGWEDIIETSGANYILWPRSKEGAQMAQLVTSGRWRILYDDAVSVLLVRPDFQLPSPLQPSSDSAYRRLASWTRNLEQRRFPEAEKDYQGALDLMPYLKLACYSLSQAQALQGDKEKAIQTLEHCHKIFPDKKKSQV